MMTLNLKFLELRNDFLYIDKIIGNINRQPDDDYIVTVEDLDGSIFILFDGEDIYSKKLVLLLKDVAYEYLCDRFIARLEYNNTNFNTFLTYQKGDGITDNEYYSSDEDSYLDYSSDED